MCDYILEARGVSKCFPGTKALNRVQLQVHPGEVHAICGENGAGKSTLMNIIGGVFPPTEGELFFDGKPVSLKTPKDAQNIGIGFVHQELSLCPHLTAAENIFIGRIPKKGIMIDFKRMWDEADKILSKFNANFSSRCVVSNLTVSEQQIVEIAKAVSLNCKLLILDEPTSSLTDKEVERLFEVIKSLKLQGISILYISHRMAEIFRICDRVTVFKDGCYVTTMNTSEAKVDDIIRAMVGREINTFYPPKSNCIDKEDEILQVKHLSGSIFSDINFSLRKGEILGFAGLVGSGRSEVMRALCAIDPCTEGKVYLNGEEQYLKNYRNAIDDGICYLTEDRKSEGLFLEMSIQNNMTSASLKDISHFVWLDKKMEYEFAMRCVNKLNIKIPSVEYPINSLSGGNQQKCLVGKWLSMDPKVIIMDEPTRGIDVGVKSEIHSILRNLAQQGVGVIIVSSELPEVLGICDRIVVMHEGTIAEILEGSKATEENVMRAASGEQIK